MYSVPSPPPWNGGASSSSPVLGRAAPSPSSPTSPTRPGRLRGLSYLRNYTQHHLLSRDSHNNSNNQQRPATVARAESYPAAPGRESAPTSPASQVNPAQQMAPTTQRSATDSTSTRPSDLENLGSTSGWLPTVGGQSVASRVVSEPQSIAAASSTAVLAGNSTAAGPGLTTSMSRTRSATVDGATDMPLSALGGISYGGTSQSYGATSHQLPSIRFSPHQDPRAQRPSLVFGPMARILPTGTEVIKVGRYSERDNPANQAVNVPSSAGVGFKSKVVSRRHCEFWCTGGRWYIKDVKSSSGTFLNHIRLSQPGTESRPFPVQDGDIVQLGIDFKGGEEMIFRCVKIKIELNKGWQTTPNSFK